MITARTDTGKTTTLLKILAYQRRNSDPAAFISDDMTIVSPNGTAMDYPKPLTISYHTLHAVNTDTLTFWEKVALPFQSRIHSRSGRRFAFLISKTHLPAATINMITQMIVPPPKYFVSKLIPKVKLTSKARLDRHVHHQAWRRRDPAGGEQRGHESICCKTAKTPMDFHPMKTLKNSCTASTMSTCTKRNSPSFARQWVRFLPLKSAPASLIGGHRYRPLSTTNRYPAISPVPSRSKHSPVLVSAVYRNV